MQEIYGITGTTARNELVLFLLDGSGSMRRPANASDSNSLSKSAVLDLIVKGVLQRINESQSANMFRIGIIGFANEPIITKNNDENYFTVPDAIKLIKPSTYGFVENAGTDIARAFEKAIEIANEFYEDEDMAEEKQCTLILCTDGKHFEHETDPAKQIDELQRFTNTAESFKALGISPNIACVSLGSDADLDVLLEISTVPDLTQQKRFDKAHLLNHLKKDNYGEYRLCMVGHENNNIGNQEIETIRRFLIIGTKTT
jgi:Mg-chelatase subunit ChlD